MIAYELLRKRPPSAIQHIREVIGRAVGFNADPLHDTPAEQEAAKMARELRQKQLAEGNKPDEDIPMAVALTALRRPGCWQPLGARPAVQPQPGHSGITAIGMGKIPYVKWLNEMVYPRFPVGTLVTTRSIPFVPSAIPRVWWTVLEIQEIHYAVEIDRATRDPKAVGLSTGGAFKGPVWYPPALLRPLFKEEIEAIDSLRDQAQPRPLSGSGDAVTGKWIDAEGKPVAGDSS